MTAVDWERAPEGAAAHAVDADGYAWWFKDQPRISMREWVGFLLELDQDFDLAGDWRESLVIRPTEACCGLPDPEFYEPTDHEWELAQVMDEVRTLRDRIQMAPRSTVYFPGLPFEAGTTYSLVVLEDGE